MQEELESSEQSRVWTATQLVEKALREEELEEGLASLKTELVR